MASSLVRLRSRVLDVAVVTVAYAVLGPLLAIAAYLRRQHRRAQSRPRS